MLLRNGILVLTLCLAIPAFADTTPGGAPETALPSATSAAAPVAEPPVTASIAEVIYIPPTYPNILRTLVRFNALDLNDNNLLDDYAKVTDCDIYEYYYRDDFKWDEIRKKMRASADINMNSYPVHYYYTTGIHLDRYDFAKQLYSFTDQSTIKKVNLFTLLSMPVSPCPHEEIINLPKTYQAVVDVPFSLAGLPLAPADAQALLRQMNDDKNTSHVVIVQFDITITFVERLHKEVVDPTAKNKTMRYFQGIGSDAKSTKAFRLDGHIDAVNFYEDAAMKKLIYTVRP